MHAFDPGENGIEMDGGRNSRGRFVPGHAPLAGAGRPRKPKPAYRAIMHEELDAEAWGEIVRRAILEATDRKFDSAPSSPDGQGEGSRERGTFDPRSVFCACLVQRLKHLPGLFRVLARPYLASHIYRLPRDRRLGQDYQKAALPVVKVQLQRAGVRLARVLNEMLSGAAEGCLCGAEPLDDVSAK